ncbi:hypothetical protein HYT56_03885 [Candidatus Woesearchaeota archaeon]|nr:hypothetical protein [Candidatus Woesearchaeota archaeon]
MQSAQSEQLEAESTQIRNITQFEKDICNCAIENFKGPVLKIRICEVVTPDISGERMFMHHYKADFFKNNRGKNRRIPGRNLRKIGESIKDWKNLTYSSLDSIEVLRDISWYLQHQYPIELAEMNAEIRGPYLESYRTFGLDLLSRIRRQSST